MSREKLRAAMLENFSIALGRDPVCCGRVSSATVEWLADEAMRACDAVGLSALAMEAVKPTRRETGSARKGDSAVGDSRNAQGTPHD